MKMPWKSDTAEDAGTATAVLDTADSFEEQLAPLEARRHELESRRSEIDAEIAQRTDARTSQLLAGEAVTEPAGILPLRETRFTVEQALASLALQISDVKTKRATAAAAVAREQVELACVATREAAESAGTELRTGVRDFILTTYPMLVRNWRAALAEQRAAAAAAGHPVSQGGFPGVLFAGLGVASVIATLEETTRMGPSNFDATH